MQIYCSAAPIRRTREHERTDGRAKRVRSRLSAERKTVQKKCRSDVGRVFGCLVVPGASRGLVLPMLSNALLGNVHSKTKGSISLLQRGRVRLGEGRGDTHSARFLGSLAGTASNILSWSTTDADASMGIWCSIPFGSLLCAVRTWTTTTPSNRIPSAASSSSALTGLQKSEEIPGKLLHPAAQILPFSQLLPSGHRQVLVAAAGRTQEGV